MEPHETRMNTLTSRSHLADSFLPWLTCVAMLAALAMVFLYVPNERVQGEVQRIFYFHLPSACTVRIWLTLSCRG